MFVFKNFDDDDIVTTNVNKHSKYRRRFSYTHIRKSRMTTIERLPSSWSKWKHAFACNNPSMKDLSLNFSTHVPPNFDSYRNFRNVWLRNPGGGQNWPNVRQSSRSVVDWSRVCCYTFKKFKNRNSTRTTPDHIYTIITQNQWL